METEDKSPFANFSFPLNVYAYVLSMEPEGLRYLHYGWFDDPTESIAIAQERSTQKLLSWLPPAPVRILEVGVGVGTTLALLFERGYDVLGITPDISQIEYIQEYYEKKLPVHSVGYEYFEATPGEFDYILFQESGQYIPINLIFSRAANLLRPGGSLIIFDEVVIGNPESDDHLHPLTQLKMEAMKHGFHLVEEQDLSLRAAPTVDFLLTAINRYRDDLIRLFALSDEQIDALNKSNQKYRRKYSARHYGYTALHFRTAGLSSRWEVADISLSHSQEMLLLFREVFNQELGETMRSWKYASQRGHAFGVWNREGKLVAHYGGFVRLLSIFGEISAVLQIGDVMVHPSERAVMTKRGAFFLAASGFFDCYVGIGKPYRMAFGFPNHRAIRIGQRLGLYASVERIYKCGWSIQASKLQPWLVIESLFDQPDWIETVDRLWQKMLRDTADFVLVYRDSAYLRYRYQERPGGNYQAFVVRNRFTRRPKCIVIVKKNGNNLDWMDFVGLRSAIPLATRAIGYLAGKSGAIEVTAWLTGCMLKDFFFEEGKAEETDIEIAQSDWNLSKGLSDSTRGHWWLMYGDTDFL